MLCCLNPRCNKPINSDEATVCQNCGFPLVKLLRSRYRAIQPIGQGGFGRTYLAADEDRLGTQCVIKQFSPRIEGTKSMDKAIALFNQEALRLYDLGEHPQIPNLLAYFEQDGYLYLIQQFIEGQNLLQEMRQKGAFSERQIRDLLADLLPVLRFIHNHQVIHRDITPTNVLRRRADGRLMLIDFGIAKQLDSETSGDPGTRIGTEGYAPMEQFRSGKAFPASDLYSLGATCLHLMTETKPDMLYDPLAGRWIWREHLLNEKKVVVSNELAHVFEMMLKDMVSERYQSADEAMRDLNADYFIPKQSNTPTRPPAMPKASATPRSTPRSAPSSRPAPSQPSLSQPPISQPSLSRPSGTKTAPVRPGEGACAYILSGHSSWVTSVAIATDGITIASGSLDDTVRLWNPSRGELLVTVTAHRRGVNTLAFSAAAPLLVSGGDDSLVKIWNTQTAALVKTLSGHARDISAVALSPDGQILATASEDRTLRLWQMANGSLLKALNNVGSIIKTLAISPDGRMLVTGGFDNTIKLWSLQTGETVQVLTGHLSTVNAVAISADNQVLVSGSKDKTVKVWDVQAGRLICTLADHNRDVNAIAIAPDSRTVVSGSTDTTVKVWNLDTGSISQVLLGHTDSVNALAISSDGGMLVSGSSDKTIRVWRM